MLSVRGCIPGDIEMRNYCLQIFKILRKEAPSLFSDFELLNDELGAMVKKI